MFCFQDLTHKFYGKDVSATPTPCQTPCQTAFAPVGDLMPITGNLYFKFEEKY